MALALAQLVCAAETDFLLAESGGQSPSQVQRTLVKLGAR